MPEAEVTHGGESPVPPPPEAAEAGDGPRATISQDTDVLNDSSKTRASLRPSAIKINGEVDVVGKSTSTRRSQDEVETFGEYMNRKWTAGCKYLANSNWFQVITTLLTIYALFGDDVRLAFTKKPSDPLFDALTITCIAVFGLEVLVCCFGKPDYYLSFFFTLDVLATGSLFLDIITISESLFSAEQNADGEGAGLARAGRAGRAGTRVGRVVRIIRIIRLVRLVKLYKAHLEHKRKRERAKGLQAGERNVFQDDEEDEEKTEESRVGKKLSEITTRRVILLVLLMLFAVPMFRQDGFFGSDVYVSSAAYAADGTYNAMREMIMSEKVMGTNSTDSKTMLERKAYEIRQLHLMYYHNHHGDYSCSQCQHPHKVMSNFFWVGFSNDMALEPANKELLMSVRIGVSEYSGHVPSSTWDAKFGRAGTFRSNPIPEQFKRNLQKWWNKKCSSPFVTRYGMAIATPNGEDCPMKLRYQEIQGNFPNGDWNRDKLENPVFNMKNRMYWYYDLSRWTKLEAMLNMGQTVFVVLVLGVGSAMFSKDANNLVLYPVERMITKLNRIRKNPFEAIRMSEEEIRKENTLMSTRKSAANTARVSKVVSRKHAQITADQIRELHKKSKRRETLLERIRRLRQWAENLRFEKKQTQHKLMETVILEKTIIKLGGLCALAFGEAGSAVIAHNMKESDTTSAIRTMVDGQFIDAVFGFCDIRNFTDATEILQDAVMLYVNQISEIVHTVTDLHSGSPNKNIGDAFLLVWRLGYTNKDNIMSERDIHSEEVERIGELSVVCFVRIISATNRSPVLATYRLHEGLLARMPGYRVKMGFGLHRGWAIEGAIGSEFKVDASYLSPNVNLSAQLEAATKQYGVYMLISDMLANRLTSRFRRLMRRVDKVTISGMKSSFYLYTIDLDPIILRIHEPPASIFQKSETTKRAGKGINRKTTNAKIRRVSSQIKTDDEKAGGRISTFTGQRLTKKDEFVLRMGREERKKESLEPDFSVVEEYLADDDIKKMTERYTPEFFYRFSMAFVNYESGEWQVARTKLEELQECLPEPSEEEDLLIRITKKAAGAAAEGAAASEVKILNDASLKLTRSQKLQQYRKKQAAEPKPGQVLDGPSARLLSFMKTYDYVAPPGWPGHRALTGV